MYPAIFPVVWISLLLSYIKYIESYFIITSFQKKTGSFDVPKQEGTLSQCTHNSYAVMQ